MSRSKVSRSNSADPRILKLVKQLADPIKWNWAETASERDAADKVLMLMAKLGLVKHKEHPLGGNVWIVDGQLFGRTDSLPAH